MKHIYINKKAINKNKNSLIKHLKYINYLKENNLLINELNEREAKLKEITKKINKFAILEEPQKLNSPKHPLPPSPPSPLKHINLPFIYRIFS